MGSYAKDVQWIMGDMNNVVSKTTLEDGAVYVLKNPEGKVLLRLINRKNNDRTPQTMFDKSRNGVYMGDGLTPVLFEPEELQGMLKILEMGARTSKSVSKRPSDNVLTADIVRMSDKNR